jgi:hypothetical protein
MESPPPPPPPGGSGGGPGGGDKGGSSSTGAGGGSQGAGEQPAAPVSVFGGDVYTTLFVVLLLMLSMAKEVRSCLPCRARGTSCVVVYIPQSALCGDAPLRWLNGTNTRVCDVVRHPCGGGARASSPAKTSGQGHRSQLEASSRALGLSPHHFAGRDQTRLCFLRLLRIPTTAYYFFVIQFQAVAYNNGAGA